MRDKSTFGREEFDIIGKVHLKSDSSGPYSKMFSVAEFITVIEDIFFVALVVYEENPISLEDIYSRYHGFKLSDCQNKYSIAPKLDDLMKMNSIVVTNAIKDNCYLYALRLRMMDTGSYMYFENIG